LGFIARARPMASCWLLPPRHKSAARAVLFMDLSTGKHLVNFHGKTFLRLCRPVCSQAPIIRFSSHAKGAEIFRVPAGHNPCPTAPVHTEAVWWTSWPSSTTRAARDGQHAHKAFLAASSLPTDPLRPEQGRHRHPPGTSMSRFFSAYGCPP